MNMIKFAKFISYLTATLAEGSIETCQIEEIAGHVEELIAPQTAPLAPPKADLRPLFEAMNTGRKIDAIKEYRMITGEGMKESKGAVEWIMNKFQPQTEATLGDILKTATNQ